MNIKLSPKKAVCSVLFIIMLFGLTAVATCAHLQNKEYDNHRVVTAITENAESKSRNCCAWYVMKALHKGGCYVPIVRACDYKYVLPRYGFVEVARGRGPLKGYTPSSGDIVVFDAVKKHIFGHIAIWNGEQWVSDFKQKFFIVAKEYNNASYIIFAHK